MKVEWSALSEFDSLDLEQAVDEFIDRGGHPQLFFQPVVALCRLRSVGYEALSRFPDSPSATPDEWFAAAKRIGRAVELETLVLEKAIGAQHMLPASQTLGVNVSPLALQTDRVRALLARTPTAGIVFELTEHDSVSDYDLLARTVAEVREMGGLIAVDDAGAGYSNLQRILEIRPDFVKVDRRLISRLQFEDAKVALVEMFGSLSSSIDSWLIVEGIEEVDELRLLQEIGVPLGQGYLLGPPSPTMGELNPALWESFPTLSPERRENIGEFAVAASTAPEGTDDATLVAILDKYPDHPAVAVVDSEMRPVGLVLRDGPGRIVRRSPMIMNISTDPTGAVVQANRRPAETRFDPLIACDDEGVFRGITPINAIAPEGPAATAPKLG